MKYRIHNGDDDYIDLEGESTLELKKKADAEVIRRGWNKDDCWSERLQ